MEKWQKDYIIQNLPSLVQSIECNEMLLGYLQNCGILHSEELQKLKNYEVYNANAQKAKYLLEILFDKKGGYEYEYLVKALYNCNQTTSLATLFYGTQINFPYQNALDTCGIEILGPGITSIEGIIPKVKPPLKKVGGMYEDDSEFVTIEEYYAPEGIWGWVIVFAAFCHNFAVDGISLSYGVMTEELTKNKTVSNGNLSNISASSISGTQYQTIGSILLAVTLLMGPWASVLAERFGFRRTAMCGSVIATLGVLSSWAISPNEPNFWAFVFGFGILTGIGFGILFTVSIVIVGLYFSKNRALATGITVAGTGVGTLVMAPVINLILKHFDWQGAVIFQGSLCAVSILFGALYREIPKKVVKVKKSEVKHTGDMTIKQQLKELVTSPSYLVITVAGSLVMMGYFAPFGFLVGISNAVGRIIFSLLANKIGHSINISNISLTVGGIVTVLYPLSTTHYWLIVCSVIFGLYAAIFATLRSIVIMDIVDEEKFNVGFGLSLKFMGVATLFSNSFGGYLKDKTDNYDMSFYVAGNFLILSAVICYPLAWTIRREMRIQNLENG